MSEGGNGNERFLWDDDLWDFPIPVNTEGIPEKHLDRRMMDFINTNSPEDEVANDVQVPTPMPPPPPKPPAAAGRKRKAVGGADNGKTVEVGGESDYEMHILSERERRKKMRDMFDCLHSLLPQLPPKADKSTIVDEAATYIRSLEETLEKLQKKKLDRIHGLTSTGFDLQTYTSPNVVLNTFGGDAHISICAAKQPGLFTAICYVLDKYRLQVVSAQVSSNQSRSMYMIHTHATHYVCIEEKANGPSEHFPVEEIYKEAAAEIMQWTDIVGSCTLMHEMSTANRPMFRDDVINRERNNLDGQRITKEKRYEPNHMVMEEALLEPRLWGDETNSSEKISSHRAELQVRSRFQNNNTVKD
ncbi:transcription factor bHLH95-like [Olea europaea var. sylvestris]|uniref:transcription factor bHLH95-like n=1 Tax=Olea europaea var. sylvestris TaxID=158386 RepID=UPI000C1CCD49|nr:transcription factor bHLH95-like [Olea europaea var. sylvestris]